MTQGELDQRLVEMLGHLEASMPLGVRLTVEDLQRALEKLHAPAPAAMRYSAKDVKLTIRQADGTSIVCEPCELFDEDLFFYSGGTFEFDQKTLDEVNARHLEIVNELRKPIWLGDPAIKTNAVSYGYSIKELRDAMFKGLDVRASSDLPGGPVAYGIEVDTWKLKAAAKPECDCYDRACHDGHAPWCSTRK